MGKNKAKECGQGKLGGRREITDGLSKDETFEEET